MDEQKEQQQGVETGGPEPMPGLVHRWAIDLKPPQPELGVVPMPAKVSDAICIVMANMESVAKSGKNTHGNYNFASTDDIYAALTKKMGDARLAITALEDEWAMVESKNADGKPARWLRIRYLFLLSCAGDNWIEPRNRRTIFIQITGPQTFQAAESYCWKQYLRGLFKVPTGDKDLDELPENYEFNPVRFSQPVPPSPSEADLIAERARIAELTKAKAVEEAKPQVTEAVKDDPVDTPPETVAQEKPTPNFEASVRAIKDYLAKVNKAENADTAVDRFFSTFDGKITTEIDDEVRTAYDNAIARIEMAAKNAPPRK